MRAALLVFAVAIVACLLNAAPIAALTLQQSVANSRAERRAAVDLILANETARFNWRGLECDICQKAIGAFIDFAVDHGCDLADGAAAAACSIAGIFEPLCAAALIEGCNIIVSDVIKKHITSHEQLCKDIHMCNK